MGQRWFKFQREDGSSIWVLALNVADALQKLIRYIGGKFKLISNGDNHGD